MDKSILYLQPILVIVISTCFLYPIINAQYAVAQNGSSSISVPFNARYGQESMFVSGSIHLVVQSSEANSGCIYYSIHHNAGEVTASFQDWPDIQWHAVMSQPELFEITICDEQQCIVQGQFGGKIRIWSDWWGQGTITTFSYWLYFTWNRCTNEWSFPYIYLYDVQTIPKNPASSIKRSDGLTLEQNYPNPFNPSTTISYNTPEDGHVLLNVYDVHGRVVSTLVNNEMRVGTYTVEFDGSKLSSGVYLYRLEARGQVMTKTMILMK